MILHGLFAQKSPDLHLHAQAGQSYCSSQLMTRNSSQVEIEDEAEGSKTKAQAGGLTGSNEREFSRR